MKPTSLKKNDRVKIINIMGNPVIGTFKERIPRALGRKAYNVIRVNEYAGLNGPDDDGTVIMSDYDVSRRCELACKLEK